VGGGANVGTARVGLLHAHLVTVEAQLVDDVRARARILGRPGGPAADRARQNLHVRAGVVEGEPGFRPRARRAQQQQQQSRPLHANSLSGGIAGRGQEILLRLVTSAAT
jgi:hypothetical protein